MLSNLSVAWNLEVSFPIFDVDLWGILGEIWAIDFSFVFALALYLQLIVNILIDLLFAVVS